MIPRVLAGRVDRFSPAELLEPRIAPAVLFSYIDVDGDKVTVKVDRGTNAAAGIVFDPSGHQLRELDLTAPVFHGANVEIVSTPAGGGNGFVNVGFIDGTGVDLASVFVDGDLGQIDAGDATPATPGLGKLNVRSLGVAGLSTQAPGGSLESNVHGELTRLQVAQDIVNATVRVGGGTNGQIDFGAIGGSLTGGAAASSGSIFASGDIGKLTIGFNVSGGGGDNSGKISTHGRLGELRIGGSVFGSSGSQSTDPAELGQIRSDGDMGMVFIAKNLTGGAGSRSAQIRAIGEIVNLEIRGSVVGSSGERSAQIFGDGGIGSVLVVGDVRGSFGDASALINASAADVDSVRVGGSLIGGAGVFSGSIANQDGGNVLFVSIGNSIRGGSGDTSGAVNVLGTGIIGEARVGGSVFGGGGVSSGVVDGEGGLGRVHVGGNVIGGNGDGSGLLGSAFGHVGVVTVLGSVLGEGGQFSGAIFARTGIDSVNIGGHLSGGPGFSSGVIDGESGALGSVRIAGSIFGGSGEFSGTIFTTAAANSIEIAGDLRGDSGRNSGRISVGQLVSGHVRGSIVGGSGHFSGSVFASGDIDLLKIGRDLRGASISGSASSLTGTGFIRAFGDIHSIDIGGSLVAGVDTASGTLTLSGAIDAFGAIGKVKIGGDIAGNATNRALIAARGQTVQTSTDLAIGSVEVGGGVRFADILAGYEIRITPGSDLLFFFNVEQRPVNPDAQIGTVKVAKGWTASNLIAGIDPGDDELFGTADDAVIAGANNPTIVSRIASIVIGGPVAGTAAVGDFFAFEAQHIASMSVNGAPVALTAGLDNILLATDVRVREFAV